MINPYKLPPLFLALVLGSMPLLAQPAPDAPAAGTAQGATRAGDKTAPAQEAPAAPGPAQKSALPTAGKDSPFDYRPSEEISEDVPVSFPVDI
jgi:hypothetical protein